jgi:hypothetical protein
LNELNIEIISNIKNLNFISKISNCNIIYDLDYFYNLNQESNNENKYIGKLKSIKNIKIGNNNYIKLKREETNEINSLLLIIRSSTIELCNENIRLLINIFNSINCYGNEKSFLLGDGFVERMVIEGIQSRYNFNHLQKLEYEIFSSVLFSLQCYFNDNYIEFNENYSIDKEIIENDKEIIENDEKENIFEKIKKLKKNDEIEIETYLTRKNIFINSINIACNILKSNLFY